MDNFDTGLLLNDQNIKLHRKWFEQMTALIGVNALYRKPIEGKTYNGYGELDACYEAPEKVGFIYEDHPTQKTMRKLGWNAELSENNLIIHVPYDLDGLQAGCLFILPSAIDSAEGRVFKVLRMSNIAIYPASIACELSPVYVNELKRDTVTDFKHSNFNLLHGEDEE